jgi:hypothetical protein
VPGEHDLQQALDRVFSRPEFQEPWSERAWRELGKAVVRLFDWLSNAGVSVQLVIVVVLLAVLVLLLWHLVGAYKRVIHGGTSLRRGVRPPERARASPRDLLAEAERLLAEGRAREAARALQHGMLLQRCAISGVPWEPSVSDGEWLARFGWPDDLARYTRTTQRVAFSDAPAATLAACAEELRGALAHTR